MRLAGWVACHRPLAAGVLMVEPSVFSVDSVAPFLKIRYCVLSVSYKPIRSSASNNPVPHSRTAPISCPEPARPSCPSRTPAGSPRRGCRRSSTPFRPGERGAARPRTAAGAASRSRRHPEETIAAKCRVRSRPRTSSASSGMWFDTITFRRPAACARSSARDAHRRRPRSGSSRGCRRAARRAPAQWRPTDGRPPRRSRRTAG